MFLASQFGLCAVSISLTCLYLFFRLLSVISYRRKLKQYQAEEAPQYPNKDTIFGLDYFQRIVTSFKTASYLDLTFQDFKTYGWTFQVNELGKTVIKPTDPGISKAFHTTNFDDTGLYPLRKHSGLFFFGPGVAVNDGPIWEQRRTWLRPSLDRVHIANFEILRRHSEIFMSLLPKDASTVDLAPLFARFNLDTASDFIFGKSLNALTDTTGPEKFRNDYSYAVRDTAIRHSLGYPLMYLYRDKAFKAARDEVYKHVDARVDEALERREKCLAAEKRGEYSGTGHLRLVDELANETQDQLDLRYQIIAVYNPGHKQTGHVLTNAFFLLSRHPEVWAKCREEIMPTARKQLTYELLKSYTYVNWTIKETSRLLTTATLNQRQALRDFLIPTGGGPFGSSPLFVPRGTVLEIHTRAMHRRPDIWRPDAEEFRPERWKDIRPGFAYVVFSAGPRTCPGQELSTTEILFMLVTMLRAFTRVERRDPEERWVEEMNMTFESKNGALVGLRRGRWDGILFEE